MTSLRDSEVLKVVAGAPVSTIDKLGVRCREVLHPVDLAGLRPEVVTACKVHASKPKLLRLGAVLGVELTSVDEDGALSGDQLLDVIGVVKQIVGDKSLAHGAAAHAKDG